MSDTPWLARTEALVGVRVDGGRWEATRHLFPGPVEALANAVLELVEEAGGDLEAVVEDLVGDRPEGFSPETEAEGLPWLLLFDLDDRSLELMRPDEGPPRARFTFDERGRADGPCLTPPLPPWAGLSPREGFAGEPEADRELREDLAAILAETRDPEDLVDLRRHLIAALIAQLQDAFGEHFVPLPPLTLPFVPEPGVNLWALMLGSYILRYPSSGTLDPARVEWVDFGGLVVEVDFSDTGPLQEDAWLHALVEWIQLAAELDRPESDWEVLLDAEGRLTPARVLTVVEEVTDPDQQIALEEARRSDEGFQPGDRAALPEEGVDWLRPLLGWLRTPLTPR